MIRKHSDLPSLKGGANFAENDKMRWKQNHAVLRNSSTILIANALNPGGGSGSNKALRSKTAKNKYYSWFKVSACFG